MSHKKPSIAACCIGEIVGTFLLIFIGCGIVHTAVITGSVSGSWQVGMVWGLAVALAVYAVGSISGGHINPAVTLSLAVWDGFPWKRVIPYMACQFLGAAVAALLLYLIFSGTIAAYEKSEGIVRGQPGSEVTASMYGEYFPNPTVKIHGAGPDANLDNIGLGAAMLCEVMATGILVLSVFALTDVRNSGAPGANFAPFFVGMTVAVMVAIFGPMTQACMNPARDFGPRLIAYICGWGHIAFPGPRGSTATLLVYLVAPLTGGLLGGLLYRRVLRPPPGKLGTEN